MNKVTSASLGYQLSLFTGNKNSTPSKRRKTLKIRKTPRSQVVAPQGPRRGEEEHTRRHTLQACVEENRTGSGGTYVEKEGVEGGKERRNGGRVMEKSHSGCHFFFGLVWYPHSYEPAVRGQPDIKICPTNFIAKLLLRLLWFFRRAAALFRQIRTFPQLFRFCSDLWNSEI